jgi:hypothetical protein
MNYPQKKSLMLGLLLSGLIASLATAQPVSNPVFDSGIDLGGYNADWTDTMVDWSNVVSTTALPNGSDVLAVVQSEIFDLSEAGGGVLYFPAGIYHFSDTLYLADGVVIRGATPSTSSAIGSYTGSPVRVYNPTYAPSTIFRFPRYEHSFANNMRPGGAEGSIRDNFFKSIEVGKREESTIVPDATHASNYGIVNIDIDGAVISINDRNPADVEWGSSIPKNLITAKNILIFGNRVNNATVLAPTIPTASQNAWQIWGTRTRGKIDAVTAGYTLIANNAVMDQHYRFHVLGEAADVIDFPVFIDTTVAIEETYRASNGNRINASTNASYTWIIDGKRHEWFFPSDGYGIRLNHVLNYTTAHTAIQEPSKHRDGMGMINNFVFGTTRVGLMAAGNGLVLHGNVRVDILPSQSKFEVINEQGTSNITNNSATQENRGIDVTGGDDVVITSNYVQVRRGTFNSGYLTIDGEGLLLQESSSTIHPTNWLIQDNILHSYIGIYRVVYTNGMSVIGNTVYGNWISVDGSRNGFQGRTGGTVTFQGNTANSIYSRYNIRPRGYQMVDLGGNSPAPQNSETGNGGVGAGAVDVDSIPGLEIISPTRASLAGVTPGTQVTVRARVTRHPDDEAGVLGVKVFDGITGYPANMEFTGDIQYWGLDKYGTFTADSSTGVLTVPGHQFTLNQRVYLSAEGGDLPTGISPTTSYFVREITADTFRISTTSNNNNLVSFSDNGSGTLNWTRPNVPIEFPLALVEADPVTGAIGGGIYEGTWIVPEGFEARGLLMAEVRLEPQTGIQANAATEFWNEANWAFIQAGDSSVEVVAPKGVNISMVGGNASFSWKSVVGLTYQLEASTDGLQSFNPVGSPISGNGDTLSMNAPNTATPGSPVFYRLAVSAE